METVGVMIIGLDPLAWSYSGARAGGPFHSGR